MPSKADKEKQLPTKKRIFITGGASGLGKAIALKYAAQGYKICIGDIHQQRAQETIAELNVLGADAFFQPCDTRQLEDLEQAKNELLVRWGGIDIVINNAGIAGTAGPIEDVPIADWQTVLDINLMGVARGCIAFTPLFKLQGFGYFVNISSAAGLMNVPQMSSYNASKAGVISLSETLKLELEKFNIGISVVCPAFFKTNLTESMKATEKGMVEKIAYIMSHSTVTADDVASDIFSAVQKKRFWVLPHKQEHKLWLLKRYFPRYFYKVIRKNMSKLFSTKK
jgi:NAD(P)-dependent dehydrogenase (short-subunit alcohol dehydrogenase family)